MTDEQKTKTMAKIRALFAKAKASEYEAEAEAFAAKAQDLLSRHNLTRSDLGRDRDDNEIVQKGISVGKGPYVRARMALLRAIGEANGVLVMIRPGGGTLPTYGVLRGTAEAIEGVEMLHAHLDVFANRNMAKIKAEKKEEFFYKNPTTMQLRRSWLFGFSTTVGERLEAANKKVDEDYGGTLLPVLMDDLARARDGLHLVSAGKPAGVDSASYNKGRRAGHGADIGQSRIRTGRAQLGAGA